MTSESATAIANPPAEPAREIHETIIEPPQGWQSLQWADVWAHRNLIYFMTWRDLKVRYKQTALGALWAIIQPLLLMVVFAVFFGERQGTATQNLPYVVFLYAGLLPWTFMSQAVGKAAMSLVQAERLIEKVYFPRLVVPISAVLGAMFDFAIASCVLGIMMIWYRIPLTREIWLLPVAVLLLCILALGVGTLYASLNVTYRDFRHLLTFLLQIWMFATPSIYDPAYYDHAEGASPAKNILSVVKGASAGKSAAPKDAAKSPAAAKGANAVAAAKNAAKPEAVPEAADAEPAPEPTRWTRAMAEVTRVTNEVTKYVSLKDLNPLTAIIAFFQAVILGSHLPWMKVAKAALFSLLILTVAIVYFRRVEGRFADII